MASMGYVPTSESMFPPLVEPDLFRGIPGWESQDMSNDTWLMQEAEYKK
jgi:hypothetical protein